ncbi:hypothetical protein SUGI_1112030 [Cryptomeria japonica]|uniref:uncharacterized protein LOC131859838 n=1 Tax=Cryptomeria japonica TaxID=3369 RepID=UPI002414C31C|nr:uncharacterized protein LOC131859838 [Cryptomeria japonica]GLJ52278.1 hypothetical protein SUGI_1112030 [Cryptomeria japonica]
MEFPDVYDWICRPCQWKEGMVEPLELTVFADSKYSVLLRAKPSDGKMSLSFYFLEGVTSIGKYEIGRYDIGNCSEESMQNNLLPVLLWLFIDPFILRSSQVICEAAFSAYLDMFREMKLEGGIIEPTKFGLVFNSLISAGCTFFTNDMGDELVFEILAQTQQNTLILMDLGGTHRFMGILGSTLFLFSYLSSNFGLSLTRRILKRNSSIQESYMQLIFERVSRISYNSSNERSWMIMSYCPLSSLKPTARYSGFREKAHLQWADVERESILWGLNNNQLQCVLQFEPKVKLCPDCIEVSLHMDNVRCDVYSLDMISDNKSIRRLPNERHFPAKICLIIGPENGSAVQSVSLSASSPNPTTDILTGSTSGATIQSDRTTGFNVSRSTTYTERISRWDSNHSVVNNTEAKIEWIRYDPITKSPVFDSEPPKISTWTRKDLRSIYKSSTHRGTVVFTRDDYPKPITWRLYRNLEGQTLKWKVQAFIWLTYWPNTEGIRYSETRCHDFRQLVDLTLQESSSSTSN